MRIMSPREATALLERELAPAPARAAGRDPVLARVAAALDSGDPALVGNAYAMVQQALRRLLEP